MPIQYSIPTALVVVGLIAALACNHPRVVIPAAFLTTAAGAVLTGLVMKERLYLPALITAAATLGAITLGVTAWPMAERPAGRAPRRLRDCPAWCDIQHLPLAEGQQVVAHERVTGGRDLTDGGIAEVRICRMDYLTGSTADDGPTIVLAVYGQQSADIELTPDQAAVLATVLAADLSGLLTYAYSMALAHDAGWLAHALAEAARLTGFQPLAIPGGVA